MLLTAAVLCAACAGDEARQGLVEVKLDEFSIHAPASALPGDTHVQVLNAGDIPHTFLLLRTRFRPDKLPVRKSEVDLRRIDKVRELPKQDPRDITSIQVNLAPGRYVMICNIAGHYQSGMRAPLLVR